jgi:hypothetical protein
MGLTVEAPSQHLTLMHLPSPHQHHPRRWGGEGKANLLLLPVLLLVLMLLLPLLLLLLGLLVTGRHVGQQPQRR